ncbi:hypothetical protein TRFO_36451 [Tritrichomonas foetus]|uniref:Uncharacterized protein n=1 Tax=Tritrichomonas foetus TaxID=1144522 RepID=A0A1J4JII1_9EUKA|nr:hypothetical protein TRFO_36451 [Tritrichomonas foetus]|eukprot:OHS97355.1 hypothetical protein TRFO_36451 [Tritrichomonas foetus]
MKSQINEKCSIKRPIYRKTYKIFIALPMSENKKDPLMFSDEESISDEICYLDINFITYDPKNLNKYDLKIDSVIETTMNTIHLTKRDDKTEKTVKKKTKTRDWRDISKPRSPPLPKIQKTGDTSSPPRTKRNTSAKKESVAKQTFLVLKENIPMIKEIIVPLFWLMHLKFHFPDKKAEIDDLKQRISYIYREFLYPFQTDGKVPSKVVDKFIFCLPYFFTQAIQDIFIRLLCGNPVCMDRDFRMALCSSLVEMFSGVKPIDSLLKSRLSFYFVRAPEADVPDKVKKEHMTHSSVVIPTEDISTLIDMHKRQRPYDFAWHAASVSPVIAKAVNRKILPYTHDTTLFLTLPKNGESDWTTDLPPLMPPPVDQSEITDITKYCPHAETRSLLHRSRRPNILAEFRKEKDNYHRHAVDRCGKENYEFTELRSRMQKVRMKDPVVLDQWLKDLAKLQQEKKRNETPEFKKLSDIEKGVTGITEREEQEENDSKFVYEPYYKVEPIADETKKHETIRPTYSKLFERSLLLESFNL